MALTLDQNKNYSLHDRQLRLRHPRHRHRHPQDAHHDPVRRLLRPQPKPQAVAGRRLRLWRDRLRGLDEAAVGAAEGRREGQTGGDGVREEGALMYIYHLLLCVHMCVCVCVCVCV